ncbi:MAG: GAF and ANTAR domain-containing protein [Actinomycetes bacterium]
MASGRTAEILSGVARPDGGGDVPQRLVTACARALPVTGVGMVLMTENGPAGTVAVTDGPAAKLEDLQFTLGEGPCVDASRTGRPVLQPDLRATGPARWPGFAGGALDAGVRAVFAFPLRMGGIRLGVLDLYRDRSGVLTDVELAEALSFADAATTVLLHLQSIDPDAGGPLGAIPVVEDRAEVHQATGMVSVQADVPLGQALALLQARAFATEQPISALAREVLCGTVSFSNDGQGRIQEH